MSAAAFSKAPWSAVVPLAEDYAPFVLTSDGGDPFDAATLEGGNSACIANAHLTAAAPEMHDELEQWLFLVDSGQIAGNGLHAFANRTRALLAKARAAQ